MNLKFSTTVLIAVSILFLVIFSTKANAIVKLTPVDPLKKVLKESSFFPIEKAEAHVARGEYATLQFVVRSVFDIKNLSVTIENAKYKNAKLNDTKVGFVGYVKVGRANLSLSSDRIRSLSDYYPDPILDDDIIDVDAEQSQPIWLTIPIPKEALPGIYEGSIKIEGLVAGKKFSKTDVFSVNVYPVTVNRPSLWTTYWFKDDAYTLAHLNDGKPVEKYSDTYWEKMRMIARMIYEHGQNVVKVDLLREAIITKTGDDWQFDFSNADKIIQLFIDEGVIGRIEGSHLGYASNGWNTPMVVRVPVIDNETIRFKTFNIQNDTAKSFYQSYIPALVSHLKLKGWDKIYIQHIADEPGERNVDSWIEIALYIQTLMPEIKLLDAAFSQKMKDIIGIWVPRLEDYNKDFDFFQNQQKSGKELWFYTCCLPTGEYANRFIELPLLKTRYIHWLNYRYDMKGYLHWALNWWNTNAGNNKMANPFEETTTFHSNDCAGGLVDCAIWSGGDAWIVYPYKNKIISSIRYDAMRDGLYDYELLKMLETKDAVKAKTIAKKLVPNMISYDMSIDSFREARKQLLIELSH